MAAVVVIQLTPSAVAKPSKMVGNRDNIQLRRQSTDDTDSTDTDTTDTDTDTDDDDDDDDDSDEGDCVTSILNFVIAQFNAIVPPLGVGIATCIDVCGVGTAECVSCIATIIPPIPMVPTDLAGCS